MCITLQIGIENSYKKIQNKILWLREITTFYAIKMKCNYFDSASILSLDCFCFFL